MTSPLPGAGHATPSHGLDDRAPRGSSHDRLAAATRQFEAVLVQEMLKAMRDTVPDGGLLDTGQAQEMFTALLDQHVASEAARQGQSSLAATLYRQFVEHVSP